MKLSNIKGGGLVPVMNKHGGNMHIRSIYLLYVYMYIYIHVDGVMRANTFLGSSAKLA